MTRDDMEQDAIGSYFDGLAWKRARLHGWEQTDRAEFAEALQMQRDGYSCEQIATHLRKTNPDRTLESVQAALGECV